MGIFSWRTVLSGKRVGRFDSETNYIQENAMPISTLGSTTIRRAILWALASLLATLGVTWLLVKEVPDLPSVLARVSPPDLVFACVLVLANYFLRIKRWRVYLATVNQRPSFGACVLAFTAGLIGCLTPGKAGELVRCWSGSRYGIPWPVTLATLGVERISDLFSVIFLALIGALVMNNHQFTPFALLSTASLAAVFVVLRKQNLRDWVSRIPRVGGKLTDVLPKEFWVVLNRSQTGGVLGKAFILGTIGWLLEALCLYLIARSIGASPSLAACMAAFGFGVLIGALSMIPGGLVSAEAVMASLLVWSGCSLVDAIAAVILFRFCSLWFGVLLGAVSSLGQVLQTAPDPGARN